MTESNLSLRKLRRNWREQRDQVDDQLQAFRPFRALAAGEINGRIKIKRLGQAAADSEEYARLAGSAIPNDAEVLVLPVGGKPVVLGVLQRANPALPRTRTRREIICYAGASTATSFVTKGFQQTPTITTATNANADDSTGFWLQHNTSATLNNVASVVAGTNSDVRLGWSPDIVFAIRIPTTITSIRSWWGLFASAPSGSDDPAIEGFGFRFSAGASDTTIQAWSNDGAGGGTITGTGVAVVSGDAHELRAVVNADATAIDYLVDGVWKARHTTNLPTATTLLNYGIYCTTLTAAARALRWGRITLESRP